MVFGLAFILGIPVLMLWVWPQGWSWTPRQPEYEQRLMGVYATLGVFLILAAREPLAHAGLIWFTLWSSLVHGGIMLVQAILDETGRAGLPGRRTGAVPGDDRALVPDAGQADRVRLANRERQRDPSACGPRLPCSGR